MNPNIAVVGCGRWGRNLVRNFAELGALRVACDADINQLHTLAEKYPQVHFHSDLSTVLSDPEIRGVVVATPASTHFRLAKAALNSGKDVLVEKPMTLHLEEGKTLTRIAKENGLILMVGHEFCYHPAILELNRLVKEGSLGEIHYVYSNQLSLGQFRQEENVLWSFAPHDISMVLLVLDKMPESVVTRGGTYVQEHIPDTAMMQLDFGNGVQAHIFVSWLHPYKERKLTVIGDRGMAVFDDLQPAAQLTLHDYTTRWDGGVPSPSSDGYSIIEVDSEQPLQRECQHFLECIERRQVPRTDGHNGLAVLRVLEASQQSLDQNGAAVCLTAADEPVLSG